MNISLLDKENACIIWIIRGVDQKNRMFSFTYRFFGAEIGNDFPGIQDFKIAKHAKGNSHGEKKQRPNIREVPKRSFEQIETNAELFEVLFGKE